ncbi:MAG: hypothetical protein JKY65_30840 [Planctomycetes bacterium]|nr:hypothetical protein [Planctomycetota bacterium]
MVRALVLSLSLLALTSTPAQAQGTSLFPRPTFPISDLKDGLRLANDTTIVLSTGPGVGGAFYRLKRSPFFKSIDSNQINLRIYLGSSYSFSAEETAEVDAEQEVQGEEEPEKSGFDPLAFADSFASYGDPVPLPRWRPFLIVNYGTATSIGDLPVRGIGRSEVHINAASYSLGVGVRFDPYPFVSFLPTFSLSYNHVRGEAEGNGLDSAIVRLTLNREVVNWRSESLTYLPELEIHFRLPLGDFELRLRTETSLLISRTFSASTPLHVFNSRSLLVVNTLELDWNTGLKLATVPIHLVPSVRHVHIDGDAVAALGTSDLVGVAFAVVGDTHGKVPFSNILGVQAGYLFGVDLEAWSVSAVWDF